jgi:beta-lactamase regulating signal transducer with metallopeptidase domain/peptidoglycan/xylan/chitin deacetylase (PgdA/CDA1 family)
MNLNSFAGAHIIEQFGWTLIHSVWQIALVSISLAAALKLLRNASANVRYSACLAAMLIAAALPAVTFVRMSNRIAAPATSDRIGQYDTGANPLGRPNPVRPEPFVLSNNPEGPFDRNGDVFQPLKELSQYFRTSFPPYFPFAAAIWLMGVALFSLRIAGGILKLREYRSGTAVDTDAEWDERLRTLRKRIGIGRRVRLIFSEVVPTPIAFGTFRPLIIIPASLLLQMEPRQLESIIAHELIHIRRYDPIVNILQNLAEALFFYHPGVWWISKQIRLEREFAADASVMATLGDSGVVYASALANLEEIRLSANMTAPPLAAAANGGNLMLRIRKILDNGPETIPAASAWPAAAALAVISSVFLAAFLFSQPEFVNAQDKPGGKKIAIGFVSIPPLDRSDNPPKDSDATARLMISKLKQYQVPAIGFVQGSMISDGEKLYPVRANIVKMWRDAGLEIGIGNFKHVWFYNTPYDDYVAGVDKNEQIVDKILGEKGQKLRFFSYPYLNTGRSVAERDRFEAWLNARGLRSVKYTIDNQEWMYSYAYDMARNDNDINTMNEVRIEFVRYMDKMFDHYEAYSREMFGRDIPQTMVLTPSRLVTDSADELFGMIKRRGYKFVPMDEALSDEAYKTADNMTGEFGNSWFERWTFTQGKTLRDEPEVSEAVQSIWKARVAKK